MTPKEVSTHRLRAPALDSSKTPLLKTPHIQVIKHDKNQAGVRLQVCLYLLASTVLEGTMHATRGGK